MKKRNEQIEGLRGIGCLMVLLFHLTYRYCGIYQPNYQLPSILYPMRFGGTYGVFLFLIISFFFMGNREEKGNVILIILKKYYNLLVPYILSISLTYLCEQFMDLSGRNVDFKTYLVNLTMLQTLFGYKNVDGAHWYLYTLLILSCWILIIEKYSKHKLLLYFAYLILVTGITYTNRLGRIFHPCYASIAIFVIMIKYYIDYKRENKKCLMIILVAICSFFLITYQHGIINSLVFLCLCTLFIMCYNKKIKFLTNPILIYVGSLSYYIYLIHQNISYMILNTLTQKSGVFSLWYLIICIPIILGVAVIIKKIADKIYAMLLTIFQLSRTFYLAKEI